MRISLFRSLAFASWLALPIFASAVVAVAQPKLEMHRASVNTDDGSGWHPAVSTKGSFSIRVPIPFNDFTTYDARTGEVSHVIGGKSSEGIKFVVAELPINANTPDDLGTIPKSFSSNPANKVSGLSRTTKDGADILSFSVTGAASSAHLRYIRTKSTLYTLSIEFPNAHREDVAAIKDKFFQSFQFKGKT